VSLPKTIWEKNLEKIFCDSKSHHLKKALKEIISRQPLRRSFKETFMEILYRGSLKRPLK